MFIKINNIIIACVPVIYCRLCVLVLALARAAAAHKYSSCSCCYGFREFYRLTTHWSMAENDSIVANKSCGYCLEFDVGKKKANAPRCVLEYCCKPWPSEALLREKQCKAAVRRKVVQLLVRAGVL